MKEDNPAPKSIKGDNTWMIIISSGLRYPFLFNSQF